MDLSVVSNVGEFGQDGTKKNTWGDRCPLDSVNCLSLKTELCSQECIVASSAISGVNSNYWM